MRRSWCESERSSTFGHGCAAVTVHPPTQPRAASAQCAEPAPSASPASARRRRRRHGGRIWTTGPKARAFTRGSGNWDRSGSPQTSSTCFTSGYDAMARQRASDSLPGVVLQIPQGIAVAVACCNHKSPVLFTFSSIFCGFFYASSSLKPTGIHIYVYIHLQNIQRSYLHLFTKSDAKISH